METPDHRRVPYTANKSVLQCFLCLSQLLFHQNNVHVHAVILQSRLIFLSPPLFAVNCWPSESGSTCDVNIEYELQEESLELNDVVISIPIP